MKHVEYILCTVPSVIGWQRLLGKKTQFSTGQTGVSISRFFSKRKTLELQTSVDRL